MGTEFYLDDEEFKKLLQGNFMVKITKEKERSLPFILSNVQRFLGDKNSMNDREWTAFITQQKKKYYQPQRYKLITSDTPPQENKATAQDTFTPKFAE